MIANMCDILAGWCITWPWRVLTFYGLLALAALPLVLRLPLEADVRDTLPAELARTMERLNTLFGTSDMAFLLVQTAPGRTDDLVAFAQALQERLSASRLIRSVEFGYAPAMLTALGEVTLSYAPLLISPTHLDELDRLLTPDGITARLQKTLLDLSVMGASGRDSVLLDDPLQIRPWVFARLAALRGSFRFAATSPYFLSQDGTALLVKVAGQASIHDMASVKATVALVHEASEALLAMPPFHGLTLKATGGYFFAAESERIIRHDMIWNVNLSMFLICLLITWTLRRWSVLLYVPIPTLLSLYLALGAFALLRPKLNALTLGCAASLIGLGVDYTIHLLTQYFDHYEGGQSPPEASRRTVRESGGGLLFAACTTIVAFAAFLGAGQQFLQEMGLLAGLGIFGCALLSVTLCPALLACLPSRRRGVSPRTLGVTFLVEQSRRTAYIICSISLALCVAAVVALSLWPPGFETDLRNIHAAASPTLRVQTELAMIFGGSQEPLTLLIEGPSEEHVLGDLQRLQPDLDGLVHEGLLAAVVSPSMLYPDVAFQDAVLQRLRQKDPEALATTLVHSLQEAGFDVEVLRGYVTHLWQALEHRQRIDVAAFRDLGFADLLRPLLAHDASGAVGLAILFPTRDLWAQADRAAISARLTQALDRRRVRGSLTGFYTISYAAAVHIGVEFGRITLIALLAVVVLVSLHFRRLQLVGLVLVPLACGVLWTAGTLALCGVKVNMMNLAILPMLLGIGIDYGIYIVHCLQSHDAATLRRALQVTGTAISLSALTTQVGFGTLALSRHQGIASVGLVAFVGITACVLASLCTLPAVLQLWVLCTGKRQV